MSSSQPGVDIRMCSPVCLCIVLSITDNLMIGAWEVCVSPVEIINLKATIYHIPYSNYRVGKIMVKSLP